MSAPLDMVVRGGTVAGVDACFRGDVGIAGGKVAALGVGLEADEIVDAEGCFVVPGAIDVHTHFESLLGGAATADDYESGSRAAAFGGITSFVNYAFQEPGETLHETLERERRKAEGSSRLDFGFHPIVTDCRPDVLEELASLPASGVSSVKLFTAVPGLELSDRDVLAVLARSAAAGLIVNVHAEDGALVDHLTAALRAAGRTGVEALPHARPAVAEALATAKVAAYAGQVGCTVYFVHLSSAAALRAVARARSRGVEAYVETRPIYLFLTDEQYTLPDEAGRRLVAWPPLRSERDRRALWRGLARGDVDTYATDHTTWTLAQKTDPALDFAAVPGGVSNVETSVGMLYAEGVATGRISLGRFVAATSTNPAKLFGLWPRKGTIAVGSDADVTVIDPARRFRVTAGGMQSRSDYDPFEGYEATGWPRTTIVGGRVLVDDGRLVTTAARGSFLHRAAYTRL